MLYLIKDRLKEWTILVVEDEPDSLEVASRWLRLAGANVLTAENGQEGLEIARTQKPHFIIADLSMPVMDGWEMLYDLRQYPDTTHTPVIALTAHVMPGIKERVLGAGFIAHISKPLNPHKFVEQVINIIKDVPELAEQIALIDGGTLSQLRGPNGAAAPQGDESRISETHNSSQATKS